MGGDAYIALCLIAPPDHPVRAALVAADLRELFAIHPDFERNDLKPNRPPPGAPPVSLPVVDLPGLIALGRSDSEIDAYIRHWLGPLLDFDAEHRSNLVAALRAYRLDNWGDCPRTARTLGIDTTTARNRLHHVRQLLAVDLTDSDTRFHLQVATRLLR